MNDAFSYLFCSNIYMSACSYWRIFFQQQQQQQQPLFTLFKKNKKEERKKKTIENKIIKDI